MIGVGRSRLLAVLNGVTVLCADDRCLAGNRRLLMDRVTGSRIIVHWCIVLSRTRHVYTQTHHISYGPLSQPPLKLYDKLESAQSRAHFSRFSSCKLWPWSLNLMHIVPRRNRVVNIWVWGHLMQNLLSGHKDKQTHKHTHIPHTHSEPTALSGPIKWLVKVNSVNIVVIKQLVRSAQPRKRRQTL